MTTAVESRHGSVRVIGQTLVPGNPRVRVLESVSLRVPIILQLHTVILATSKSRKSVYLAQCALDLAWPLAAQKLDKRDKPRKNEKSLHENGDVSQTQCVSKSGKRER